MLRPVCAGLGLFLLLSAGTPPARAGSRIASPVPDGAALVRSLGPMALAALAPPGAPGIGALVRVPTRVDPVALGLRPVTSGIARLWATPEGIVAFGQAHPDLPMEVLPSPHWLLDTAGAFVAAPQANASGFDGTGVVVGIADTGLDVTHPDFRDSTGRTRVAWLLDLGSPPRGVWPDLEQKYGITDPTSGELVSGAVWSADDIDAALIATGASLPEDAVGHGTMVTSCATGNGSAGTTAYRGIAPGATIVFARITDANWDLVGGDGILSAVDFIFDRADAMGKPVVANLSFGSDFGPHDGTLAWEQALASHVGPDAPGHALVAAAGNSGAILPNPVHEQAYVPYETTVRVPIVTHGAQNGGAQVWVAMHPGATLRVGLEGPNGTWIPPVDPGESGTVNTADYVAAIVSGSTPSDSPVPPGSLGAVLLWQGAWPSGTYNVTLSGSGTADLYVQGSGDAVLPDAAPFGFLYGVREGTINIPATNPSIISVGCTINKPMWTDEDGVSFPPPLVPVLDATGGTATGAYRDAIPGEPCWFSSAGPNLLGIQKPEIAAPGAFIVAALSRQAVPPQEVSIFDDCPTDSLGQTDPNCEVIDARHAISAGTSFSAPLTAGAVAVLLQKNPSLTQGQVLAALQGGAHPVRGPHPFDDQASVGELDVQGALDTLDPTPPAAPVVPQRSKSWLALGADEVLADGSTPLQIVLQLRGGTASKAAIADGFAAGRLALYATVDGAPTATISGAARRGPGVWTASILVPAGLGGYALTLGATFDGQDVVEPRTIPISIDSWMTEYGIRAHAGCSATGASPGASDPVTANARLAILFAVLAVVLHRGKKQHRHTPTKENERGTKKVEQATISGVTY